MVVHGAGLRDQVPQARRLGRGIRVERRLLHGPASGPEPGADHLVRIGLPSHAVRPRTLGGTPPREPRHREVEAAPEEVHRTAFPEKRCAKPPEHVIRLDQDAPVPIGILRIVRCVRFIGREADRLLHLDRNGPELYVHVQFLECGEIRPVEFRHRLGAQRDLLHRSFACPEDELVLDEVELRVERAGPVEHGAGREAPGSDAEGDVPPVVLRRSEREAGLSDDLRPHVERGVRVLPCLERQVRPGIERRDVLGHWRKSTMAVTVAVGCSSINQCPAWGMTSS